ncbi:isochorismatase family cysteine hydrolase [Salimicrobium album]|uniref:Nicotinamidase-related amidase n=1 Tax=Salimicrobium album TaxID=50717 RepID=A0A1H3AFA7_9BACI|nr:isochorismatase family cysteine hydrolase [Salimicrobium album]SDX27998.1 Nicotinamidase-related amidase [Salimicrobium album]
MDQTALVLIDIQKENNFDIDNLEKIVSRTKKIINTCREKNIPIIYTRQINRADTKGLSKGEPLNKDGSPYYYSSDSKNIEIINDIKPQKDDIIIDKYRWSAFHETSLDLMLRNMGVTNIIIGGLVSDGCLMTSVFDAYFRDYQINLVEDICATTNTGAHMASMLIMSNWVYTLSIYDTKNIINKLNGIPYDVYEAPSPDALPFTPETMKKQFQKIANTKERL